MAAINNINNNIEMMLCTKERNTKIVNTKIAKINKEINIREKYIGALDNHIRLTKEYIKTIKESQELGKKRISLIQDTNDKLQALLDRNSSKIDISDVKLLDRQLDTLSKKDSALKVQTSAVEAKIEKLAVKVDFVEKQITKLAASSNTEEITSFKAKQAKTDFAVGYRPTAYQIANLEISKNSQENNDFDISDTLFQQKIRYSQQNIYESIVNSFLKKLV